MCAYEPRIAKFLIFKEIQIWVQNLCILKILAE